MKSQPSLDSRSKVVLTIYKCSTKISEASPKNLGRKKASNFGPLFSQLPHSTQHISGTKRSML